jgi:hypothetical protein
MTESSFRTKTAAAKKLFGAAAKLAQKQTELATLNNVTLPKLYHAIGKRIVGSDKLPADLEHHREKIRHLESGIAATPEEIKSDPAGGFAAKAKQFAQQAAQKAAKATGDAAATVQIQAAYVALGKEAVEKYGDKAVPKEFQSSLSDALRARTSLEDDIRRLQQDSGVTLGSFPRLALMGTALWVLCLFLPFMVLLGSVSGLQAMSNTLSVSLRCESLTSAVAGALPALTNAVAIAAIAVLLVVRSASTPALKLLRALLIASLLLNATLFFTRDALKYLASGYYIWLISFAVLAMALHRQIKAQAGSEVVHPSPIAASRRSMACFVAGLAVLMIMSTMFADLSRKRSSASAGQAAAASIETATRSPGETARGGPSQLSASDRAAILGFAATMLRNQMLEDRERERRRAELEAARPVIVCPYCGGVGCGSCRYKGVGKAGQDVFWSY